MLASLSASYFFAMVVRQPEVRGEKSAIFIIVAFPFEKFSSALWSPFLDFLLFLALSLNPEFETHIARYTVNSTC